MIRFGGPPLMRKVKSIAFCSEFKSLKRREMTEVYKIMNEVDGQWREQNGPKLKVNHKLRLTAVNSASFNVQVTWWHSLPQGLLRTTILRWLQKRTGQFHGRHVYHQLSATAHRTSMSSWLAGELRGGIWLTMVKSWMLISWWDSDGWVVFL